jgi:1-deoxy-D-xylulose-5-phosphate synthase
MIVSAPMDEIELRNLMFTAQLKQNGPFSIRYPRGKGVHVEWRENFEPVNIGKGRVIKSGNDIAVLTIGTMGNFVKEISSRLKEANIDYAHYDMRFVKPIDEELLHEVFKKFSKIITIEDGVVTGGFGSAVIEFMADNNYTAQVFRMGIPDQFIEHGTPEELYALCGIGPEGIYQKITEVASQIHKPNKIKAALSFFKSA